MIEFIDVTKKYNNKFALKNVNIKISKGEFVYLIGHSGAGKSTFFNLLLKIIEPDNGKIIFGDYVVNELPNRLIPVHRRKMGIVYQNFSLLPKKTIAENIEFGMRIVGCHKSKIRLKVPQILTLVGLKDKIDNYPDELSIGEQQRVAIARAIVNNPQVLIADEPTGNLDPVTGWEIMTLLEQINNRGTTVIMITHSQDIVNSMPKRVVTLSDGEVISDEKGKYKVNKLKNIPIEVSEEIKKKSEVYKNSTGKIENIQNLKPAHEIMNEKRLKNTKQNKSTQGVKKSTFKINKNQKDDRDTKPITPNPDLNNKLNPLKHTLNEKINDLEKTAKEPNIEFNNMADLLGLNTDDVKPTKSSKIGLTTDDAKPTKSSKIGLNTDDAKPIKSPQGNDLKRDSDTSPTKKERYNEIFGDLKNESLDELINNAVEIDPFNLNEALNNNDGNKKVDDDTISFFDELKKGENSELNNKNNEEEK